MRSPSRVTATLCVSSITVDSGAYAASVIGTVIEYPLTGYTGTPDADRREQLRRVAAERHQVAVGAEFARVGPHAGDAPPLRRKAADVHAEAKAHAQALGHPRQVLRELEAVAGFVVRQAQCADELFLHVGQRRFVLAW